MILFLPFSVALLRGTRLYFYIFKLQTMPYLNYIMTVKKVWKLPRARSHLFTVDTAITRSVLLCCSLDMKIRLLKYDKVNLCNLLAFKVCEIAS